PGAEQVVARPDVLLLEGLNVLRDDVAALLDVGVYLDADAAAVEAWYVARFHDLRRTVFRDAASYFHRYAQLTAEQATATAERIWREVNLPNLRLHVEPTRASAGVVLHKAGDHAVRRVWLADALSAPAGGT